MNDKIAKRKGTIGIFDSGFGGITILKSIIKSLPEYKYVYLGDSARTPYGTRTQETIYEFTKQAVDFLFSKNCELVVLACNSASSEALRKIQQQYLPKYHSGKKVLGVLIPAAEDAVSRTKNKRIGVLATSGTVKSKAFLREIQKLDPQVEVFQQDAPLLVPAIEAGEHYMPAIELMLRHYLNPLLKKKIDTLILGCTHYGILKNKIQIITGEHVELISEGKVVAVKLKDYLKRHPEIEKKLSLKSGVTFLTTDITDSFEHLGSKFFGSKFTPKKVILN